MPTNQPNLTGERLPFAGVMPPCGQVHRSCAISCQKAALVKASCIGSCELAPYEPGSTIFIEPPLPDFGSVPTQPKKRINVRAKGQRGEREVVKILQAAVDEVRARYSFPPLVLQRNALQSHLGGADLHGLEGFAVEVKFVEDTNVLAWWSQATRQADELTESTGRAHVPVLFYRSSGIPWTVKFRAYVNTPGDRDQIEMDVEAELDDFLNWFTDAYDESLHIGDTLRRGK